MNHTIFLLARSSTFKSVDENGKEVVLKFNSTAGRFLLANVLPKHHKIKFTLIDRLLTKKNVSEVIDTIFRFFITFFFLSRDPIPQFKLLYFPEETPPKLLKNPCSIFLNFCNFFDLINLKTYFKIYFFICN